MSEELVFNGAEGSGLWNAKGGFFHIASHGVAGGTMSELQGGRFGHGFFSAGFSKLAMSHAGFKYDDTSNSAIASRTEIAAVIGGTSSVISGGKFANGAWRDASGHATLWNGSSTVDSSNYFNKSNRVMLWKLPK